MKERPCLCNTQAKSGPLNELKCVSLSLLTFSDRMTINQRVWPFLVPQIEIGHLPVLPSSSACLSFFFYRRRPRSSATTKNVQSEPCPMMLANVVLFFPCCHFSRAPSSQLLFFCPSAPFSECIDVIVNSLGVCVSVEPLHQEKRASSTTHTDTHKMIQGGMIPLIIRTDIPLAATGSLYLRRSR